MEQSRNLGLKPLLGGARGFTLIEILIAISLMAVLTLMCWRGLESVIRGRDRILNTGDAMLRHFVQEGYCAGKLLHNIPTMVLLNTSLSGYPDLNVSGYTAFPNPQGSQQVSEIRSAAAYFTRIAGSHSWKFGSDLRWYIDNRGRNDRLSINFAGNYTRGPLDNSPAQPIGGIGEAEPSLRRRLLLDRHAIGGEKAGEDAGGHLG